MADITMLAGPLGGLLAGSWGTGAVMGYSFAAKTIGRQVRSLRADMDKSEAKCREDIRDLTARLRTVEDRAYNGLERQLGQVRESTVHLIDGGVIRPVGDVA